MKISMIMPVFNEDKLLPYHLKIASPFLDEIILVDGSPNGKSASSPKDIATNYDNVTVIEGIFPLNRTQGGWDKQKQISYGVERSSGDIIIITACDWVYANYKDLVDIIKLFPDGKIYYCHGIEFFIDTSHIRLSPHECGLPMPVVGYVIMKRNIFKADEISFFSPSLVKFREYIYMMDMQKYHYGWIMDFNRQVRRHTTNVKSGLWGKYGESILKGGDKSIDLWAISHVLNYNINDSGFYTGHSHPLNNLEFGYRDGFDDVTASFKKKYGVDYYDCI